MIHVKQTIKTVMRNFILIILLSFIGTKLYAGEVFTTGYGQGAPFAEANKDNNTHLDHAGTVYKPFDSFASDSYTQLLKAPGDRPGFGEGIGVIPVRDNLFAFALLIVVYGVRSKRSFTRNK